jgi:Tol biopolymer transport system component
LAILVLRGPSADVSRIQFEVFAPDKSTLDGGASVELSPDGRKLAFLATSDSKSEIWIRALDSSVAYPLQNTEGAIRPFWSPDSNEVAFFVENKLKKVGLNGAPPVVVADLPVAASAARVVVGGGVFGTLSGTWNADGVILISGAGPSLLRILSSGGSPTAETDLDDGRQERSHRYPHFLPDGKHYLYLVGSGDPQYSGTYAGTLGSKERHFFPGINSASKYSTSGHLLFIRQGVLMGQPFDAQQLKLEGEAFPVADPYTDPGQILASLSVSAQGGIAYRASATGRGETQLAWLDRMGNELKMVGASDTYLRPEVSPDGKLILFGRGNPVDIWMLSLESGQTRRLTTTGGGGFAWAPDSRSFAFSSKGGIYQRSIDQVGEANRIWQNDVPIAVSDWSRDGRYLAYIDGNDIWALTLFGDQKPVRITETPFVEAESRISPDGHWIAYSSNETVDQPEIYLQAFPGPGPKKQVYTGGGNLPRWSPNGKELFFIGFPNTRRSSVMGVSVKLEGSSLSIGEPMTLFPIIREGAIRSQNINPASDGRFLINLIRGDPMNNPITVILNWAGSLKK